MSLTPIKKPAKYRKFNTYDMEWYPDSLKLRLVGKYDGRKYSYYTSIQDFLNGECTTKNSGQWFYAHAGGLFDIQFVLDYLIKLRRADIEVKAAFSGSSAIIVEITKDRYHWTFLDSYWLLRAPLREIAVWMGMKKGGEEGKTDIFTGPLEELIPYNRDDCIILWNAIDTFQSYLLKLGGQLQMTVASCAMTLFRRKYLKSEIKVFPNINEVSRTSYIGSRVEVFKKDCNEANYYDINSSFPHAMTFDAPGNYKYRSKHIPDSGLYLAKCTIKTPETDIPPLPYRTADKRLYFPVGTWKSWFVDADLQLLENEGGKIIDVEEVIHFDPFRELKDYAQEIYDRRKESEDVAEKQILKILLNSLYGKFGENGEKTSLLINPEFTTCPHEDSNGKVTHENSECLEYLQAGAWLFTEQRVINHAHVPIAASITAIARRSLYNCLKECSSVYYCDTDGFACSLDNRFPVGKDLGALKLEKIIKKGHFESPKLYAYTEDEIAWTVRAKGFSRISYPQFCELLEHKEIEVERFARIRENFRKGTTEPNSFHTTKKLLGTARPKRKFYDSGESDPWHVEELEQEHKEPKERRVKEKLERIIEVID